MTGYIIDLREVAKRVGEYRIQVKERAADQWHDYAVEGFNPATYLGKDGADTDANSMKACGRWFDVRVVKINSEESERIP